jgi:hypothetical protein
MINLIAPFLSVRSTHVLTSIGGPTVILCEVDGVPTPEVTWSKSCGDIKERIDIKESDYFVFPDGSLHIAITRLSDQGEFIVEATNSEGTVMEKIYCDILDPIPPESDPDNAPLSVCDYI